MLSQYEVLRLCAPVVGRFPRASYVVASLAGEVAWRVQPRSREQLFNNMLPLCGWHEARAKQEGRRAYRNLGRYWVDVCSVPHRDFSTFEANHLRFHNEERLDVLRRPGPVLIVSAHMGGGELALQAMTARGRPFTALVEDIQPPRLGRYLNGLRSAGGGTFEPATIGGVKAALSALRRGEVVGMMADRDIHNKGVCVLVAGQPTHLPSGPWELALRTNATVIPMFATRNWRDQLSVYVEEPFHVACDTGEELAIREAACRFARLFEERLLAEPGQWSVMEDYWSVHRCGEG